MILVSLINNREILNFAIKDRIIKYSDRKWNKWIQCIPKDKNFINKVIMSRGKFPHFIIKMFELTDKEKAEYEGAKDDEELAQIIIKDGKKKGCRLRYKKYEEDDIPWIRVEEITPEIYKMFEARKINDA